MVPTPSLTDAERVRAATEAVEQVEKTLANAEDDDVPEHL